MSKKVINIALVDDHSLFRHGVANLLSEFNDIHIEFEASNGKELQILLPKFPDVDVILMDIKMPGMDGYAATKWVKDNYPHIFILALSMFDEEKEIIKMLKSGAKGYILKESSPADLYKGISELASKGYYSTDLISSRLIHSLNIESDEHQNEETHHITKKEIEFLKFCASEMTYKEIAVKMGIATRTVDNYRQSLFEKLSIKSRVGLVLFSIKNKIVEVS
ncbi:MAG TPA: response regulator transcription factor [Puia sp.]|jgi:DNA-binding NarL/FixJ family response regulator|nr:response regulator transcription factor [Puia sp.]